MGARAGIDWASQAHRVCIVDEHGRVLVDRELRHDAAGLSALVALLKRRHVELVAIERPDGILIEELLDAGLRVVAIHPNQVQAARPRFRAAAGKSDGFDAYVLAELARTDAHRFRVLVADSDQTTALRAQTRARDDLIATRVELSNRLLAELDRFWPGAATLFADLASPIALSFLERYPSPDDARTLTANRMRRFLSAHAYTGRQDPSVLVDRLRTAPLGHAGDAERLARRGIVLGLVATLRALVTQISQLTRQIAATLDAHNDGSIFQSFFRDPKSRICAATLLAEIGDCRDRYPTAESLAADAGMSPVAVESGKKKTASFRRACDKRLRKAISTLADATRHYHPWARDVYQRARSRGADHPHALRILGRAWIRILWRCWHDHTTYQPQRHGNLQRLLAAEQG
jgi:Transposase/Transposase IS116/IS110/IS902 family